MQADLSILLRVCILEVFSLWSAYLVMLVPILYQSVCTPVARPFSKAFQTNTKRYFKQFVGLVLVATRLFVLYRMFSRCMSCLPGIDGQGT